MPTGARPAESSDAHRAQHRVAWAPALWVGEWRLQRRLKSGPVNEIWSARAADGSRAALKSPRVEWLGNSAAVQSIEHEFQVLSRVCHPHVVAVLGQSNESERPALALERLDGGDLTSLAGAPPVSWLAALRDVVAAVAELHGQGLVHRDIKARNVMFDASNRVRLIDLASSVPSGAAVSRAGTTLPRHGIVPRVADFRDDLSALAALIYELYTGRLPPAEPLQHGAKGCPPGPLWDWLAAALAADAAALNVCRLADVIELEMGVQSS